MISLSILWAVVAGLVAWGAGESKLLDARAKIVKFRAAFGQIEWSTPETKADAVKVTLTRLNALFGGLLGCGLGVVGATGRRPRRAILGAAAVGAVLGAAIGGGPTVAIVPAYERYRQLHGADLPASLVLHVGLWSGIGAAAGLALGLGAGGMRRGGAGALGGLLGAIGGVLAFDVVGALAFPLDETGLPTSVTASTRLLARGLVAVPAAAAAALAVAQRPTSVGTTERR